jgi:N-acyl-D-amino-acid deacylase
MATFDTIVRGGTVIDGTGGERFVGDIGIKDGRVAELARGGTLRSVDAERAIDADGLIVAPGFIDLHTHYDAQLQWDPYATISGWHGVTTVATSNCGLGFAPVHVEERDRAMLTMSRIEAVPYESMKAGIKWEWETFPEWLDALDRIPKGVNVMSLVPTGPMLVWVMGLEAAKSGREPTADELARLTKMMDESLAAGGCGWSIQRTGTGETSMQRDYDGTPMPTDLLGDEAVLRFGECLARHGTGFIQIQQATDDFKRDMAFVDHLCDVAEQPVLFNLVMVHGGKLHRHRRVIDWIERSQGEGRRLYGQSMTVEGWIMMRLADFNLLDGYEEWRDITVGDVAQRIVAMTDPAKRQRVKDLYDSQKDLYLMAPVNEFTVRAVTQPEHERFVGRTVAEIGTLTGRHPIDAFLDLAIAEKLETMFYVPPTNNDPDGLVDMVSSKYVLPGTSDGGAHTKFVTQGRYGTDFLVQYVREQGWTSLEDAHWRLSALPAEVAGLKGRGLIKEGMAADIIVYDFDDLQSDPAWAVRADDLPADEWRLVQWSKGYRWTLVNGEPTFIDGECTSATPGRLLRSGHS